MNVKNAESVASLERVSKVLGNEQIQVMTVIMAENPMVQTEWLVIVFKYFAPVKTWRPYNLVSFVSWTSNCLDIPG